MWDSATVFSRKTVSSPDALTIFSSAWAAQNLFHLAFFHEWLEGFHPNADFAANRLEGGPIASFFSGHRLFVPFIAIETTIPLLMTFRRTRLLAVYIGVPFHFLLGLMGHWTFSSFMLALYVVIAMPAVVELTHDVQRWLGPRRAIVLLWAFRGYVAVVLLVMAAAAMSGNYRKGSFGIPFNLVAAQWAIWAGILSAIVVLATLRSHFLHGPLDGSGATHFWSSKPGWLWLMLLVVTINSASPYIGFKTETSAAMYSNMRTEGGMNNHYFMPSIRLFGFQDDIVEILDSNDRVIQAMKTRAALFDPQKEQHDILVTYFEFRRAVSGLNTKDLEITYLRNGELHHYKRGSPSNPDQDLDKPHPFLLGKIAYFRPIFKGDKVLLPSLARIDW